MIGKEFQVSKAKISLVQGDLMEQETDAIVRNRESWLFHQLARKHIDIP